MQKNNRKKILITSLFLLTTTFSSAYAQSDEKGSTKSYQSVKNNPYENPQVKTINLQDANSIAKKDWLHKKIPLNPQDIKNYIDKSLRIEGTFKSDILRTKMVRKSFSINPNKSYNFPKIIVGMNFETIISFWDSTGEPWKIEYFSKGNKKEVAINSPKGIKNKNVLAISPTGNLVKTNITVSLVGLDKPIVLEVESKDVSKTNIVYADINMHVQGRSPKAKVNKPYIDTSFDTSTSDDNILLNFLDNIIPDKAQKLKIKTSNYTDSDLWQYKNYYYLRTDSQLIFPPAQSMNAGTGNVKIYKINPTPIIKLNNDNTGKNISMEIE